jgi:hypothetical protein
MPSGQLREGISNIYSVQREKVPVKALYGQINFNIRNIGYSLFTPAGYEHQYGKENNKQFFHDC